MFKIVLATIKHMEIVFMLNRPSNYQGKQYKIWSRVGLIIVPSITPVYMDGLQWVRNHHGLIVDITMYPIQIVGIGMMILITIVKIVYQWRY